MPNIVLIMHRKVMAQGLMIKLKDSEDINILYESDYNNANNVISNQNAKVALIEVAESGVFDMFYCLELCKKIRKNTPECKLLLMCSERDEKSVKQVVEAKIEKIIDDFAFYDVTIDYLTSKLTSM